MTKEHIKEYYDIEQGTPEWFEIRRGVITASRLSEIMTPGLRPAQNKTSLTYAYELAAQRLTGHVEPQNDFYHLRRGHMEESIARTIYDEKYAQVKKCGFIINDSLGFDFGYSTDGLVGEPGLIEIKSRINKHQVKTICDGVVPSEYMPQIQGGLLASDREWLDFISYSNGMPLFVKRVFPDDLIQEKIITAVIEFEEVIKSICEVYTDKSKNFFVADWIDTTEEEKTII
jgi:putative phage-type endonuclease